METRSTERGAEHRAQNITVGLKRRWESNPRTSDYESGAHPTEVGLPLSYRALVNCVICLSAEKNKISYLLKIRKQTMPIDPLQSNIS